MSKTNLHWGSTLEDFLRDEGIFEIAKSDAAHRIALLQRNRPAKDGDIAKGKWRTLRQRRKLPT